MGGEDISLRVARTDDADAIAAIYAPIVRETAISFEAEPPSPAEMAVRIENILKFLPWLVAVRAGEVVGYAYASEHLPRAAYRWSVNVTVYLAETARGRGVGRKLYGALIPTVRAQGFHTAFAGIALPNEASVGLHQAVGFSPLGVYKDVGFKLGAWRDVGWWRLGLTDDRGPPTEPNPFPAFRLTPTFAEVVG